MDFNKDYVFNTSIGKFMVPVFHYVGNLRDTYSWSNLYYHGQRADDYQHVSYAGSVFWASEYRQVNSPVMGKIDFLTSDGQVSVLSVISEPYAPGAGNSRVNYGYIYNGNRYVISGDYGITTVNRVVGHGLSVWVDDNDNFTINNFVFVNDIPLVSYAFNTETKFGYFECINSQYPSVDGLSRVYSGFSNILEPILKPWAPDEPYEPVEPTGTAGGDGTYVFQDSDPIDFPTVPTLAAVNTGFVSLWSPTEQQMLDLSSYMWNANPLTVDFWKKLVADPKDLIFGLSLVPLNLEDLGYIDGQGSVVVGLVNTGIVMDKVSSQWVHFDCGSIDIEEAWGAYLDYDPYTKLEIYLPFCGVHPIRVDDFTPGVISLKYYIDLLSGTCVAVIKSTKSNKHGDVLDSVVYQFMGNCAAQIPVTSQQFADAVRSAISIAASIGSMVAAGVGGAAAIGAAGSASAATAAGAHTLSRQLSTGASAVENVMNIKPAIERSGAIGSTAALLGVRTPYLILTRPRMARPDKQSTYTGYPSFITETLGDISGWTIVQAIHLDAIPCTAEEMSEIDELLKGGVIL